MKDNFYLNEKAETIDLKDLLSVSKKGGHKLRFIYQGINGVQNSKIIIYDYASNRDSDFNFIASHFNHLITDGKTIYFAKPFRKAKDEFDKAKQFLDQRSSVPGTMAPLFDIGKKFDQGKLRWDLLPWQALEKVVEVYNFGLEKYGENTWQEVDNFQPRYAAALIRHLSAHMQGKKIDEESKLLHLSHLAWNALALIWFELQKENEDNIKSPIEGCEK